MDAAAVGGAFLSAFLQLLFDRLTPGAGDVLDFFRGKDSIVNLLRELTTKLLEAGKLLNDAEEKLIKDSNVKMWLDELKEAVYDAGDLVYKIDTEALRLKVEGDSRSSFTSKVMMKFNPNSLTEFDRAIKPEIEEILGRLKVLLELSGNLGLEIVKMKKRPERLPTPLAKESDVYGRDADKAAIIKLLLSDDASGEPIYVIPIVGMGGIGKTTLAQLVYNDVRVGKKFDCRAWVTDGEDKFDLLKAMKTIIKQVDKSEKCEIQEQFVLQEKLLKALAGKKFLIVLDDIWDKDPHKWDVFRSSFELGLNGSKIIVTTRSQDVASIMKTGPIHLLHRVSEEDGWRLFAKHASIDVYHSNEYSDLQEIGRKIVDKCKGLPLAIKSLGGVLRQEKDKREWSKILNSETWELYERSKIGILPALWLSYYYLPSYLKPCFSYCYLFPKDREFRKEYLILLWMAEGFLHSKNGKKMEEVGEEYFQELVSRSFFQPKSEFPWGFVMHDLMHDLAHYVSSGFIFKVDDANLSDGAKKIRHFSYMKECPIHPMTFESLSKAKGLRTILALPLFINDFNLGNGLSFLGSDANLSDCWRKIRTFPYIKSRPLHPRAFGGLSSAKGSRTFVALPLSYYSINEERLSFPVEHLFKLLQSAGVCLRVLSFSDCFIIKLPDSIGDLKYLRYLDLSGTDIKEIPDTVCNLYNLETLLLNKCRSLTRLPENMGNLINLRHLIFSRSFLEGTPLQIGKIKALQRISEIVLGKNSGFHIKLLKELQDLSGSLSIRGLENVADVEDALEADVKNKMFVNQLILEWDGRHISNDSQKEKAKEVLCALEPRASLEELSIKCYKGNSFPNWVGHHSFSNIVSVWLFNCKNCCFLPPLGQLSSLKHLTIWGVDGVERIASEFYYGDGSPAATKPFRSLERLEFREMSKLQEGLFIEGEVEGGIFPRLKQLTLEDCPRLKVSLPDYLPSLETIVIEGCDKVVPLVPRGQQMDTAFPSLETMKISDCDGQELLLEGGLPSSLKKLTIYNCKNLTALDEEAFQHLTSLEKLQIEFCEKLRCLPKGLPSSLSCLSIFDCDLLTQRLKTETGEDWPIVAHIPTVSISKRDLYLREVFSLSLEFGKVVSLYSENDPTKMKKEEEVASTS